MGTPAVLGFETDELTARPSSSIAILVERRERLEGQVSCNYETIDETAVAGRDYCKAKGVLSFESGETSKIVEIPILRNDSCENGGKFVVMLMNPSRGTKFDSIGDTDYPNVSICKIVIGP